MKKDSSKVREAAKKVFLSGPATKALPAPPPSSLVATIFFDFIYKYLNLTILHNLALVIYSLKRVIESISIGKR